jgi:hypothetical protein
MGAQRKGSNGLAVVSLIGVGFAVALALLAVRLGRPRQFATETRDDEDPLDAEAG